MATKLPKLRSDLDFFPSPDPRHPGLVIRDPMGYSDAILVIPPALVPALTLFDGSKTELDLKEFLYRTTGQLDTSDLVEHLLTALSRAGFLEDPSYEELKAKKQEAFAQSPVKLPSHAGSAYPAEANELQAWLNEHFSKIPATEPAPQAGFLGVAAPHVSPSGGWLSYCTAYAQLKSIPADRIFVILGTSHYGQPDKFGLTRKNYRTPLGEARTAVEYVDELAARAPDAVILEDYCHAVEHSIEFQVVFLQHVIAPDVTVLPILVGPFANALYNDHRLPEEAEPVKRFLDSLAELAVRESNRLFWILGVDMAHVGQRYGDGFAAKANQGRMVEVAQQDRERIEAIERGDARGFWDLVRRNRDPLKWCGSAPFYAFLRATEPLKVRGKLKQYEQWNIDPASVVSFAAIGFFAGD